MAGPLNEDILEFDLEQKWAKGLRISFLNAAQSEVFKNSSSFAEASLLKQVHSNKLIKWSPLGSVETYRSTEADGFIAVGEAFKKSKKKLVIKTADCAPLIYVDREKHLVASVHAGWKGLAKGIHLLPFQEGFDPKTTWIWCGPCLNGDSFEVGEDMRSEFAQSLQKNPEIFSTQNSRGERLDGKSYFHCWKFLELEFKSAGAELFYNVERDTFSDTQYNSYRRWKKSGATAPLQHNYSWVAFS